MPTTQEPQSRVEEILIAAINGEEYNHLPESRIEALLIELKEAIEEGGGGSGGEVLSVRGLEDDTGKKGHVLLLIQDLVKLGAGISYNEETNTISINQQSLGTMVENIMEESKADPSDIDDLFNE